jgi:hypothetical protein
MTTTSFFSKSLLDTGTNEIINPDTYFQNNLPPSTLPEDENKVKEFVNKHDKAGRRIVLVTVMNKVCLP